MGGKTSKTTDTESSGQVNNNVIIGDSVAVHNDQLVYLFLGFCYNQSFRISCLCIQQPRKEHETKVQPAHINQNAVHIIPGN